MVRALVLVFAVGLVTLVGAVGLSTVGSAAVDTARTTAGDAGSPRLCPAVSDLPVGEYPAVVDRLQGRLAVLVVEGRQPPAAWIVPARCLPMAAREAGAVVAVEANPLAVSFEFEPGATRARATEAERRFDGLAERPDRGDVAGAPSPICGSADDLRDGRRD